MAYVGGYYQRAFKTGVLFRDDPQGGFASDGEIFVGEQRPRRGLPVRQLLLFLLGVAAYKIFLVLTIGAASYENKMEALSAGSVVERAAAHIMVLDPVSNWITGEIRLRVLQ